MRFALGMIFLLALSACGVKLDGSVAQQRKALQGMETDTLAKLLQIRSMREAPAVPEFFVLGRVRMRMGYHWRPAYTERKRLVGKRGLVYRSPILTMSMLVWVTTIQLLQPIQGIRLRVLQVT